MEKIFKAKRLDNGEWVEFDLDTYSCHRKGCTPHVNKHFAHKMPINKNTICQYTGINDSQGNRIFEGDEFDCDGICAFKDGAFRYVTEKNNKSLTAGCLNLKLKLTGHNIHDRG